MKARRLPNGNLEVPVRAASDRGHLGDATREVAPGTAAYEAWLPYVDPPEPPTSRG